jgi:hypothetical protein
MARNGKRSVSSNAPSSLRANLWTFRSLLIVWAILSTIWAVVVGCDIYHRATVQAAITRDVEHDLDFAGCEDDPQCIPLEASPLENWMDIAATYLRFGQDEILESALGPPSLLLAIAFGGIFVMRRRLKRSTRL